ncbi:hypothetical protein BKA70DRAFT_1555226 [Coprinopsis sp. MPI-PUGE-AT-0042]|nr:hypothetical protein BKA70DRAFT_1555226 [Coprinopsis sp. MPI-PUGE-AT-0042]
MPTTMQQPIAGPSKQPARLRTRSKSKASRPLLSKQGSLVQLPADNDKHLAPPNKTLYTPVFYPTVHDTGNGKGKGKAKDSSGLSQATLKRLDQLSKMHVALSSGAIPDIPASSQGSSPPRPEFTNHDTQDVRDILQELPNLPPEVANNPRIMGIRNAILDALKDCNYDPSHGKWARVSDLVRLGVTSGRDGRWAGANGVDSGERVVLPADDQGAQGNKGEEREEVILPPNHDLTHLLNINPTTGTNSRGLGWCNASTEEQWMIWEDKFEDEIKLRVKIEKWQRSVVQGSQDAPLPLDEFEHDLPEAHDDEEVDVEGGGGEEGDTGLQSPPPTARGRVRVTTSGPQHLTTTRSSRPDPLKSTSALGSLGFTMSKRSAIAGSSSKPPPPRQPKRIQQPQPRGQALSRQNTANNGEVVQDLRVSLADLETSRVSRRPYAGSVAGSAISRTSSRKRELLTRKKAFEGYVSGYSSSRAGSEVGDRDGRESRAGSPGAGGVKGKGKGRQKEVEAEASGRRAQEKETRKGTEEKARREREKDEERQARKKLFANPTTQERRAAANGQMNLGDTSEEFLQSTGFQPPSLEPSFRFSQLITSTPLPLHPLPVPRSGSRKPGPTAEVLLARQAEAEAQRRRAVGPSRILNFHRDSQSQSSSSLPPGLGSSKPTSLAALKDVSMESIPGLGAGSSLHHRAPESPTPRSRKPKRKVDEMNGVSGHAANSSFGHAAPGATGEGNGESQLKKPRTDSGGWTTGRTSGSFMPYISPQGNNSNSMLEQAQLDSLYLQQQPSAQANTNNNGDGQDVQPNQISQDSIYNPSTTPSKQRQYGPPVPGLPSSAVHANDADAAPVTPTRDRFEPPPQTSRFVDLLESAKQAKQERIARRRSAKAAKFGAGLKEAVIPAPVGEVRDVDPAAAVANTAVVSQEEVVEDLRPPIPGMAEVPPPPPTTDYDALAPAPIALIADVFGVPPQPGSTPPFSSPPAAGTRGSNRSGDVVAFSDPRVGQREWVCRRWARGEGGCPKWI